MRHGEPKLGLMISLGLGLFYPALYEFAQLIKLGIGEYLNNTDNYIDMLYVWGSILNIILQSIYGPFKIWNKILMCIIVGLLITKTFFFLRIFPTLTPIVVMITNVVYDLRIFLLFYTILVFLFCQIYAVLGLGNSYETEGEL